MKFEQAEQVRKDIKELTDVVQEWKNNELRHFLNNPETYPLEDCMEYIEYAFSDISFSGVKYSFEEYMKVIENAGVVKASEDNAKIYIAYKFHMIKFIKLVAEKHMVDNKTVEDLEKWIKSIDSETFLTSYINLTSFLAKAVA